MRNSESSSCDVQTLFDTISQLTGLNVGCFYAVSTLLNRMIIEHYPVSSACSVCVLLKGIRQFFLFVIFLLSSDENIDLILLTVCAVTRKRRAELTHC